MTDPFLSPHWTPAVSSSISSCKDWIAIRACIMGWALTPRRRQPTDDPLGLLEPHYQRIRVLRLQGDEYVQVGVYRGSDRLESEAIPSLTLTAGEMLNFVSSRLRQEIERAEQAELQLEAERQRAEQAEQRAEIEQQRAEVERQRAEESEAKPQRLAERLRALGINPD